MNIRFRKFMELQIDERLSAKILELFQRGVFPFQVRRPPCDQRGYAFRGIARCILQTKALESNYKSPYWINYGDSMTMLLNPPSSASVKINYLQLANGDTPLRFSEYAGYLDLQSHNSRESQEMNLIIAPINYVNIDSLPNSERKFVKQGTYYGRKTSKKDDPIYGFYTSETVHDLFIRAVDKQQEIAAQSATWMDQGVSPTVNRLKNIIAAQFFCEDFSLDDRVYLKNPSSAEIEEFGRLRRSELIYAFSNALIVKDHLHHLCQASEENRSEKVAEGIFIHKRLYQDKRKHHYDHYAYRQELVKKINSEPERYLEVDRCGKGFVCPCCGSGTGKHGTGLVRGSKDPSNEDFNRFTCFACGELLKTDLIGIYEKEHNVGFNDALASLAAMYGYPERGDAETLKNTVSTFKRKDVSLEKFFGIVDRPHSKIDENWINNLLMISKRNAEHASAYLRSRGILNPKIQEKHQIGFLPYYRFDRFAKNKTGRFAPPAIIIKVSENAYKIRTIEGSKEDLEHYGKYRNIGNQSIFNEEALEQTSKPVFICEGEFDAMSFEEVGAEAIAIQGTSGVRNLLLKLESMKSIPDLVLALDADVRGVQAAERLKVFLESHGKCINEFKIPQGLKDPNEWLCKDRKAFEQSVMNYESKQSIGSSISYSL